MPLLQDGMIMITWANHHYLDFARSWVYHIKKVRRALPAQQWTRHCCVAALRFQTNSAGGHFPCAQLRPLCVTALLRTEELDLLPSPAQCVFIHPLHHHGHTLPLAVSVWPKPYEAFRACWSLIHP